MVPRRVLPDGFVEPCIPTLAAKPPSRPGWVHEIKHDGYRLIVRRDGDTVRLFIRRGHDWTERYPAIATAAAKLRVKSFSWTARRCCAAPMGWRRPTAPARRGTGSRSRTR
jgi:ATP-dependent DNA ligase